MQTTANSFFDFLIDSYKQMIINCCEGLIKAIKGLHFYLPTLINLKVPLQTST